MQIKISTNFPQIQRQLETMRRDIAALVTCDTIVLLPGWQQSRGATLEQHIAERLSMAQIEAAP